MKRKLIFIICAIALVGCEKTYTCTITTPGLSNPYEYEFKGTYKEMKEFEATANTSFGQTIECK